MSRVPIGQPGWREGEGGRDCPRCPERMNEVAMDWDDENTYVLWQWVCPSCGHEGRASKQKIT